MRTSLSRYYQLTNTIKIAFLHFCFIFIHYLNFIPFMFPIVSVYIKWCFLLLLNPVINGSELLLLLKVL
jgi:hypothetical protein